jgi:hypothetical protein
MAIKNVVIVDQLTAQGECLFLLVVIPAYHFYGKGLDIS